MEPSDGERSSRRTGCGAAGGSSQRCPCLCHFRGCGLTDRHGACPGMLTVGFVTVRGFNADQDVLVQQVLGVGDNGLQLQRRGMGLDWWGKVREQEGGQWINGQRPVSLCGKIGLKLSQLTRLKSQLSRPKRAGRNTFIHPSQPGRVNFLPIPLLPAPQRESLVPNGLMSIASLPPLHIPGIWGRGQEPGLE